MTPRAIEHQPDSPVGSTDPVKASAHEAVARRHNRIFAIVCGVAFLGTALTNLAIDPFRVYHDAWARPYPKGNWRYVAPGVIRNTSFDYDAITLGTSHSANFQPSVIEKALGWKAVRGTLSGSTIGEQLMVLKVALESGRAKRVFWGIDFYYAADADEEQNGSARMPLHFYDRSWRTPFNYLLSTATLGRSLRIIQGHGERDVRQCGAWYPQLSTNIAKDTALRAFPGWFKAQLVTQREKAGEFQPSTIEDICGVIRNNPQVEFVCLFPPISVLSALPEFLDGGKRFNDRVRFREALMDGMVDLPNCRLYDFEQADHITHNLDLFIDPTHYGIDVNDWMIRETRGNQYRVRRADIERLQSRFIERTRRYIAEVIQPTHPLCQRFGFDKLGIDPPGPPAVQWAESNDRTTPR